MMFLWIALIILTTGVAHAADPDWKAVERALGKSGQMQAGDVFRVGMPRTDLAVTVKGRVLRQHGIDVTALHNHGLMEAPRLFYMHFWSTDDAVKLARGLRAALDQTNSQK